MNRTQTGGENAAFTTKQNAIRTFESLGFKDTQARKIYGAIHNRYNKEAKEKGILVFYSFVPTNFIVDYLSFYGFTEEEVVSALNVE